MIAIQNEESKRQIHHNFIHTDAAIYPTGNPNSSDKHDHHHSLSHRIHSVDLNPTTHRYSVLKSARPSYTTDVQNPLISSSLINPGNI